jgi:hypothetical protein
MGDGEIHGLDDLPVGEGFGFIFGGVGGESDGEIDAAVVEVAGESEAVAAVVAAAAENADFAGVGGEHLPGDIGSGAGGVFHEDDAGDFVLLDGAAVDLADLGAGEIEHGRIIDGGGRMI